MRLSLRTKIMICCIGLVALLDLMVVVFVRDQLQSVLRGEYEAKGRNMAANLAARSGHFVLTEEYVSLLELVKELKDNDEDIVYAYVSDRKGQVLAHTFSGGFPVDLLGINRPEPTDPWKQLLVDTAEEGLVHDIAVPILKGKAGCVHVGISERRIRGTISHFTLALVGIAGLVLAVAVVLAAVLSWVVTQPIRRLIKAAEKMRDGELGQRVVAATRDEVGDLVESFNQMSDELLRQHQVLEDRNYRIRKTQEQAAWERDKLRAIIDSMVEGLVFVDAEGKISLCNESAAQTWGLTAGELLGKSLEQCPSSELRSVLGKILRQAERKKPVITAESLDLREGRCLGSYSTVHGEDGRYLGLVLLSLDISERVSLEQEQKQLRDRLFQQEKMVLVGQIAASVAHELNTPLGTILLRTQLLREQLKAKGDISDLKVVESEARRCRRITDSLLGFSRHSEGVTAITELDPLIRESLSLVENDLALKGIVLDSDYATNGATVCVDTNQIQQVLLNVIANAASAMPKGGRLRIATRSVSGQDKSMAEIRVIDEGCGMEQDVLERAFEPFFTTKEHGKGTGLGLAICRRIIEEHKGDIEIDSRPGGGTTVCVRLPYSSTENLSDE